MIVTFLSKGIRSLAAGVRSLAAGVRSLAAGVRSLAAGVRPLATRLAPLRAETGDTLIEVVISSLLVGLMAVGMLTGFGDVDHATAQERAHDEAIVLADQSQEQLRSDPASALETIGSAGHSYTQTVGGTTYTITQKAELLPQTGSNATCSVTETKRQSGNAFAISSTVTWYVQKATNRAAVTASSIVTPPTGSALEVDADNAPIPTSGVSGVTAIVKYTPAGGASAATLQQTTGSEGCVVFGGIPATSAIVEIGETPGYVTVSGAKKYPSKEVTIAPNYTTHYEVVYNKGGAIKAEFAYEGKTTYTHKNNAKTITMAPENVTGDTFVALNTKMKLAPEFEVESTHYGAGSGELYEPLPGESGTPSTYQSGVTSKENLFPFTESENGEWGVYAGDCTENNPETITAGAVKLPKKVIVTPGGTTTAQVPMSYVELNVYTPTETAVNKLAAGERWKDLETGATSHLVTITNASCTGSIIPDNETAVKTEHTQETTIGSEYGGHLADPFQAFGKFELCVSANGKTFTVSKYENKTAKGAELSIYLGQRPTAEVVQEVKEKETAFKAEEAEYKAKEGYKNKKAEYESKATEYKSKEAYKTKKAEAETKEAVYNTEKTKYTTELAKYNTEKTKYETEKTKYTTELAKYNTEKTKYETEKTKYTTEKTKYTTEKENYEKYKKEYEKTGKTEYKTKYEAAKTAYIAAEAAYKTAETEYKAAEAAYKTAETAYKTAKTAYEAAKTAYEAAKTAYEAAKTAYEAAKTAYETDLKEAAEYETPLHEYETDKKEYEEYATSKAEYETDKSQYENAKSEEKESTKDEVTVEAGTTCS
jgi:type II secretory pathway pseudopilin PulG